MAVAKLGSFMTTAEVPHMTSEAFLKSSLFTPWIDPETGVQSFILTKRVAPVQQSFYFVNPSMAEDGRYYWFYCAFPPGGSANQGRSLAVVDFFEDSVHHFPETTFTDASPLVDKDTGEVYWCAGLEIWKRSPEPNACPIFVNRFPEELARNRRPWRLATHLTFSADRRAINLDVEIGSEWFVGHAPLDGSDFVLWQKFDRCYNHAQFSPVDPDLQLIAQDYSIHPTIGESMAYENRLWLIRRGCEARPVFTKPLIGKPQLRGGNPHYVNDAPRLISDERAMLGHEWWSADGRYIWYVHYRHGAERVSVSDSGNALPELIWPHSELSHVHSDTLTQYLVADSLPGGDLDEHKVIFRNLITDKQIEIVSRMPKLAPQLLRYHVHPHPQFCLTDQLICYTTMVLGRVDVAFTPVRELV